MTPEEAAEIVAQCWCDPRAEKIEMNVSLAKVFIEAILSVAKQVELECADKWHKTGWEDAIKECKNKIKQYLDDRCDTENIMESGYDNYGIELIKEIIKSIDLLSPEQTERCKHGVWEADLCYQCVHEGTKESK